MISVGFTGTRKGMTDSQRDEFADIVKGIFDTLEAKSFHHGGCVGADDEAQDFVDHSIGGVFMHHHPCNLWRHQAKDISADFEYDEKPPLARNKDIVDASDVVIATPSGFEEQFRGSGTWATIRYARKTKTKLYIIFPDGSVTVENES